MLQVRSERLVLSPSDLSTQRVFIRPYRREDADDLFVAVSESAETVGYWMPWCRVGYSLQENFTRIDRFQSMWEAQEEFEFAAFDHFGVFVGSAGLNGFNRQHNFANVGYWIRQSRQGEGLAPDVVRLVTHFGFAI